MGRYTIQWRSFIFQFIPDDNTRKRVVLMPLNGDPFAVIFCIVAPKIIEGDVPLVIHECSLYVIFLYLFLYICISTNQAKLERVYSYWRMFPRAITSGGAKLIRFKRLISKAPYIKFRFTLFYIIWFLNSPSFISEHFVNFVTLIFGRMHTSYIL